MPVHVEASTTSTAKPSAAASAASMLEEPPDTVPARIRTRSGEAALATTVGKEVPTPAITTKAAASNRLQR
jgi:hypothetical protein